MGRLDQFENIEAWKKARDLTKTIYKVTSTPPFKTDFGLREQIRRASVSIMSNIAEGFGRNGDKEFRQFLSLAQGSALEVKSHLYVALDNQLLSEVQFDLLYSKTHETCLLIGGFMRYLGKSSLKGKKFK